MIQEKLHSAAELTEYINKVGLLPLLSMVPTLGWSAEEVVDDDCQYTVLPEGGWEWPLWDWKGEIIRESGCAYGKFFLGKAGFISKEWWPDFCNYRRSTHPHPAEGSIEEAILETLKLNGSMITRDLRKACGFTEPKMRSKFDNFITRLQMGGYIVTEDFVYPHDKHGKQYGWGWSLLTTPEDLFGREACHSDHTPEESRQRLMKHFQKLFHDVSEVFFDGILDRNS